MRSSTTVESAAQPQTVKATSPPIGRANVGTLIPHLPCIGGLAAAPRQKHGADKIRHTRHALGTVEPRDHKAVRAASGYSVVRHPARVSIFGSHRYAVLMAVATRRAFFACLENNATLILTSPAANDHLRHRGGSELMAYRLGCGFAALVCVCVPLGPGTLRAADLSTPSDGAPAALWPLPTPAGEADSFEARLGAFAHSVGATEAGSVDANVELLLPRLPNDLPEQYTFLVPRP